MSGTCPSCGYAFDDSRKRGGHHVACPEVRGDGPKIELELKAVEQLAGLLADCEKAIGSGGANAALVAQRNVGTARTAVEAAKWLRRLVAERKRAMVAASDPGPDAA